MSPNRIFFWHRRQLTRLAWGIGLGMTLVANVSAQSGEPFGSSPPPLHRQLGSDFPQQAIHFDPQLRPVDVRTPIEVDAVTAGLSQPQSTATEETSPVTTAAESTPDQMMSSASGMLQQFSSSMKSWWQDSDWSAKLNGVFGGADIGRMLGSLSLVLGGYFALVWILRLINPGSSRGVPVEVLEVLGTVPMEPRKNLQIIRLGSKLMLIVNGPEGTHSIGEITDPAEVEYLASLCPARRKAKRHQDSNLRRAVASPSPATTTPVAAGNPSSAPIDQATASNANQHQTGNHLASILQSLNGPRSGNAAIFEA